MTHIMELRMPPPDDLDLLIYKNLISSPTSRCTSDCDKSLEKIHQCIPRYRGNKLRNGIFRTFVWSCTHAVTRPYDFFTQNLTSSTKFTAGKNDENPSIHIAETTSQTDVRTDGHDNIMPMLLRFDLVLSTNVPI